jgi:hypothetical protein
MTKLINQPKSTPFFSLLILRTLRQMSGRRPFNLETIGGTLRQMEFSHYVNDRPLLRGAGELFAAWTHKQAVCGQFFYDLSEA